MPLAAAEGKDLIFEFVISEPMQNATRLLYRNGLWAQIPLATATATEGPKSDGPIIFCIRRIIRSLIDMRIRRHTLGMP